MIFFWSIFILSWTAYAAFVGLTALLLYRFGGLRVIPFAVVSALIVVPTAIVMMDQYAFMQVGRLTYGLDMAALTMLILALFLSRGLGLAISRWARSLSGAAFLAAALWSVSGPGGFFLPLLFMPTANLFASHLVFVLLFLGVAAATFLGLNRIPPATTSPSEQQPRPSSAVWKTIGSFRFWLRTAVALLALFWLAQWAVPRPNGGLVSYWGEPGMSPAVLDNAEVLCSGHFSRYWQPFRWCWRVELKSEAAGFASGRTVKARRKIIPFIVDHYWKGTGPQEIEVALFEPSENYWGDSWLLPSQENLLVALKKDTTGSNAYQLVNQVNSWLVLNTAAMEIPAQTIPEEVIKMSAFNYLKSYAAGDEDEPMVKMSAPLVIDSLSGIGGTYEVQNISLAKQALATVKNFRMNDAKTLAVLTELLGTPESRSRVHNIKVGDSAMPTTATPLHDDALAALAKIDPVLGWKTAFNLYETKSIQYYTFSKIIPEVINPRYLSQIDPEQIRKLLNGEPLLAREIARSFSQMSNRQIKDPGAVPWLGECLTNADVEVQYFGMMGLYEVCGKKEKFPTAFLAKFKIHPQKYLAPYQAWWAEHRAEYGSSTP